MLSKHDFTDFELVSLANLAPQTVEEARLLVPSLTEARLSDLELEAVIEGTPPTKLAAARACVPWRQKKKKKKKKKRNSAWIPLFCATWMRVL